MSDPAAIDASVLRLIAITDNVRDGKEGLLARAAAAARGGATCIQLRLKDISARDLALLTRELVRAVGVPVIVNDRADVAIAAGAAGVHLGPDDVPPAAIRRIAPAGFIIGTSVGSEDEIAGSAGADYAGIGPVFASASKADAGAEIGTEKLAEIAAALGIPAVAIGGITPENAASAMLPGVAGVAAIAAVFGASDPAAAAKALRAAIGT